MNAFDETLEFNKKMREPAHNIIKQLFEEKFGPCAMQASVFELDKYAGIDLIVSSKQTDINFTYQEKYRKHSALIYKDFTQEIYNAYGTEHQEKGEFFHLFSDYYFYGWANETETGFEHWFLMNIRHYKTLIHDAGGISKLNGARQQQNAAFGKAMFYSIPLNSIKPAIIRHSQGLF